jgi:hypothetical protein
MACATSVDANQPVPSDQDLHCSLFWSEKNLINQKGNSADPDQITRMWWLIWIYTVCPCHKGLYMEERVNNISRVYNYFIG